MRAARLAFALCAMISAMAVARPVELGPDELREAGFIALDQGDPARALDYATALVQRDADDAPALILQSRAARDLGLNAQAKTAAKAAWAAAETDAERHAAALVMAQALSSSGERMAAQFWLRRAVQSAPDEISRQRAMRDFNYVRSRMPFVWQLDVSVSPSNNVNNGTSAQTMEILGFPFTISGDAQALSGVEATIGLSGAYRLPPRENSVTELTFAVQTQQVALSAEAKQIAPEARGSDYAFEAYEVGIAHRWRPTASPVIGNFALTAGHNRYGGEGLSDYVNAVLGAETVLGARTLGFGNVTAERQYRLDNADRSANLFGANLGILQTLGNGDQIRLAVGGLDVASESIEIDHQAWSATLAWERAQPIGGIGLGAALALVDRTYAASPYTSDGRHDLRAAANLSLTFLDIGYMGFNPVLNLGVSRNSSNVDLYDQRDLGISIGIASEF